MPTRRRVEFTCSDDLWDRIEAARGDVPRARWIKRALEDAVNRHEQLRDIGTWNPDHPSYDEMGQ